MTDDATIRSLPVLATVNFRVGADGAWHASVFMMRDNKILSAGDEMSLAQALAYELRAALQESER